MKTKEVKNGDVVEVQYGKLTPKSNWSSHTWDGIQFRVTESGPHHARGTVVKTPPTREKSNPVGSVFTWGAGTGLILVEREGSMKTEKFTVGDIVEVRFSQDRWNIAGIGWNGLRFRISEIESIYTVRGVVLVAPSDPELASQHPAGKPMSWSNPDVLVIIKESPNQAYIDHLYERLTQNATKQELLNLAAKLEGFVTGMVVHPRPWPED